MKSWSIPKVFIKVKVFLNKNDRLTSKLYLKGETMYYDMNKMVADEIAGIEIILGAIEKKDSLRQMGNLCGIMTSKGMIYHVRRQENGIRKNVLLGDEFSEDVVRIKQLAFNKELIASLEHNKKILERVDGRFKLYDVQSVDARLRSIYRDTTGLVNKNPGFMSADEWQKQMQTRTSTLPNPEKSHITADGKKARSKSELIIHNLLTHLGIPFKNDVDINLRTESDEKIYKNADFVMPSKRGGYIILEHFGMLDREEYLSRAMHKIRIYGINGYTLNDRLFISSDGFDGSLNVQALRDMIEKLILPKVMF